MAIKQNPENAIARGVGGENQREKKKEKGMS